MVKGGMSATLGEARAGVGIRIENKTRAATINT